MLEDTWTLPGPLSRAHGRSLEVCARDKLLRRAYPPLSIWFVNAAFNSGNSGGGPLIDAETRTVAGVVVSKLAPLSRSLRTPAIIRDRS